MKTRSLRPVLLVPLVVVCAGLLGMHASGSWPASFFAVDGGVALAPPGARAWAAYPTVRVHAVPPVRDAQLVVVDVEAPAFAKAELHETIPGPYGTARMQKVSALPLSVDEPLQFRKGGLHIMLMSPHDDTALRVDGAHVDVALVFDDGKRLAMTLPVLSSEAP